MNPNPSSTINGDFVHLLTPKFYFISLSLSITENCVRYLFPYSISKSDSFIIPEKFSFYDVHLLWQWILLLCVGHHRRHDSHRTPRLSHHESKRLSTAQHDVQLGPVLGTTAAATRGGAGATRVQLQLQRRTILRTDAPELRSQ